MILPYPLSLNRYWTISRSRSITPTTEGRKWKAAAQKAAAWQKPKGAPFAGPVEVGITLHPRAKQNGQASAVRVDLDNACKLALDALQGIAYANDKQIEALIVKLGPPVAGGGMTVEVAPL